MYIDDLKLGKGWKVVEKVQHRGVWDIQEKDEVVEDTQEQEEYQQNDSLGNGVLKVQQGDLDVNLFSRNDAAPTEVNMEVLQMQSNRANDVDDFIYDIEDQDDTSNMDDYESSFELEDDTNVE